MEYGYSISRINMCWANIHRDLAIELDARNRIQKIIILSPNELCRAATKKLLEMFEIDFNIFEFLSRH